MEAGTDTQGAVHRHQLYSLDWRARIVRLKETAAQYVADEALARLEAILFDSLACCGRMIAKAVFDRQYIHTMARPRGGR